MRCIYFGEDKRCYANPPISALAGIYTPEDEIQKQFCLTRDFRTCPRLRATLEVLKATK